MGASVEDIAITIISNGETAYYSSYKGFGNIMWNCEFGLYSDKKPNAFKIFDFAKKTSWDDGIEALDEPLADPVYGILTVNFDTKTIIDDNGYGPWNCMFLQWFVSAIFKHANKEVKGYIEKPMLTKKSVAEHLKNGNFYISDYRHEATDLVLPDNIDDMYELLINLGYTSVYSTPKLVRDKDYSWGQIKAPKGWTVIIPDENE